MQPPNAAAGESTWDDAAKVQAIRAEMPSVQNSVYLNAGTNGPLPRRSVTALTAYAERELAEGRINSASWERYSATMTEARNGFAGILHCDPIEIALTHNTTE